MPPDWHANAYPSLRRLPWWIDDLLARAPACGIDRVLAITFEHNEASLRLFLSLGFEEWGRLPGACDMGGVRRGVVLLGWSR